MDGRLVRMSGQDTRRGTFVQRHSVLIDHNTGAEYQPLQHLSENQGRVLLYDSALTEYAALGIRVRVLGRQPGGAGDLGGPVR